MKRAHRISAAAVALWCGGPALAHAASAEGVAQSFFWLALLLFAAKLGTLIERFRQPVVLGEILIGVILGNLALFGTEFFVPVSKDPIVNFLAQFGAVILLFQIGLESNIRSLRRVGARAFWVASVGVVAPFVLGTYVAGPLLLPGLSSNAYLFLGAALTATSVGITGRVFRDMGCLARPEAQIVLGAAVIDDVLGLIILSIISAVASTGAVAPGEIMWLTFQAFAFLAAALMVGQLGASPLSRLFARIDAGAGMKVTFALGLCLIFAYLAHLIGLAPIVGAFAAGLVLEEVHFKWFDAPVIKRDLLGAMVGADERVRQRASVVINHHANRHLEQMIEPVGHLFVPLFFVLAGMQVRLDLFLDPRLVATAVALTVVAVLGKLVSGLVAGNVNRWLVGWGMVPRGEVGLIFAFVGKSIGVINDELFSVIVLMVMLTTLITPPVLSTLLGPRVRPVHEPRVRTLDRPS